MVKYLFDSRDLPDSLGTPQAQHDFEDRVLALMQNSATSPTKEDSLFAAIVGMLVNDGYTDPNAANFEQGFWGIRGEAARSTADANGSGGTPNKDIYETVAQTISGYPGHKQGAHKIVYYQELASVSRALIENARNVPIGSAGFLGQIRVFDDDYVATGPVGDTLSLPDFTGANSPTAPDDLVPANIRTVGGLLMAYYLDTALFFDVAEHYTMKWWNGQFPTGFDRSSKLFDQFYWSSEFRLTTPARHLQYARVLGVESPEKLTDVQPNTELMPNLMRFVASWSEYDRQQRIGDIVGGQRSNALSLTAEQIRQSGRNLGAVATLYGWGGTQMAMRRIATHIDQVFEIYNDPGVQNALGVTGPWQVWERGAAELGAKPNFVKWRTMADSSKKLMDLVAKYASVWSGSSGQPLVNDPATSGSQSVAAMGAGFGALSASIDYLTSVIQHGIKSAGTGHIAATGAAGSPGATPVMSPAGIGVSSPAADISDDDRDEFLRLAGGLLVVQGIKDDAVEQLSQPVEAQYAPSIPTLTPGGLGLNGGSTGGGDGMDALRQMVSQGQVPSFDQLKNIVMPASH